MDQQAAMASMRGQNPSPQGDVSMNDQDLIPPSAQGAQPENSGEGAPVTPDQLAAQQQQGA